MLKKVVGIVGALCIATIILAALQRLVTPKYYDGDMAEGGLIASYYDSEKNHDVIFLGDCEVYENFDPAVIYEKTGLKTYIRGSAQQLIWQSYYLLEDTLRYETPKAVVFNVLSMKYNEPQNEAYNRLTLDGMEWSTAKVGAINASMTEDESFVTYVFPILRYHDGLRDLTSEDFEYFFGSPQITTDGSYLRDGVLAVDDEPVAKPLVNDNFGETAWEYMEKIRLLCEENGITLILIKAPSVYPTWYTEWDERISDYAQEHDLTYLNLYDRRDDAGISFKTDTYDGGLHLNRGGAQKLSRYFAPLLEDAISGQKPAVVDRRGPEYYEKIKNGDSEAQDEKKGNYPTESETDEIIDSTDANSGNDHGSDNLSDNKVTANGDKTEVFEFVYNGEKLVPGMKWDKDAPLLGEPQSYFEAKSCVFEGIDRMYTYPGIEVDVSPDGKGGESISSIFLLDDSVETPEGVYIGCPKSLVEKFYGTQGDVEGNVIVYKGKSDKITFSLREDVVVSIIYELL